MAERSLVERKLEVSKQLTSLLKAEGAPLLAAYWEWTQEKDRWIFYLVPKSSEDERKLVESASKIMITQPYRSVFSLSDVFVDAHQIERARAIGSYLRSPDDLHLSHGSRCQGRPESILSRFEHCRRPDDRHHQGFSGGPLLHAR